MTKCLFCQLVLCYFFSLKPVVLRGFREPRVSLKNAFGNLLYKVFNHRDYKLYGSYEDLRLHRLYINNYFFISLINLITSSYVSSSNSSLNDLIPIFL